MCLCLSASTGETSQQRDGKRTDVLGLVCKEHYQFLALPSTPLVEQIKTHTQFPQAWAKYRQQKDAEKESKARRKDRKRQSRRLPQPNRSRQEEQRDDNDDLFIPVVQPIKPPQLLQLYPWYFSKPTNTLKLSVGEVPMIKLKKLW